MRTGIMSTLAFVAFSAIAADALADHSRNAAEHVVSRTQQQDARLKALANRGKAGAYQQIVRNGIPRDSFNFPEVSEREPFSEKPNQARLEEITSREAAIDLASLGYTAQDVAAYRERNLDLLGMTYRLFSASATPSEQITLADTVIVATALESGPSRARLDGYLSALPFKTTKSLKGSSAVGEIVYIPQASGVNNADGTIVNVSSDIVTKRGQSYLLVLSKNWYEQRTMEAGKQPEVGFNALAFLAYELSSTGVLKPFPRTSREGGTPENVQAVEATIEKSSLKLN